MTDRPLYADDYETISFRSPRVLGLSTAIRKAAERSGRSRGDTCIRGMAKGLLDGALLATVEAIERGRS